MTLNEKVAYIKGLIEGLALDSKDPQNKIITSIVDILGDLAKEVTDISEDNEYLNQYVEEIDEDLGALEDEVYGDIDDDDFDDEDEDECDCCDECIEVECPNCGEKICLDETVDFDHVTCPSCNEEFSCVCDDSCDGEECKCECEECKDHK